MKSVPLEQIFVFAEPLVEASVHVILIIIRHCNRASVLGGGRIIGEGTYDELDGPPSLEIVEAATEEDFHDLPFLCHRTSSIDGMDVHINHIGMAGSLAYEVHGKLEDSQAAYAALLKYGEKLIPCQEFRISDDSRFFPASAAIFFEYPTISRARLRIRGFGRSVSAGQNDAPESPFL